MSRKDDDRIIHVDFTPGNVGNKMMQYMAALTIADRVEGAILSGVNISEWGVNIPVVDQPARRTLRISSDVTKRLDLNYIYEKFSSGEINRVELNIYSSCVGNFLDPASYSRCFQSSGEGYGDEYLVINIRGEEILTAIHPHYTVLPPEFYEYLIQKTGLRPIFMGQVGGKSKYIERLRGRFSYANFIESKGPIRDFTTIRRSKNIVLSISTFSWLAGWLSSASNIYMPLSGFFNPAQCPNVDLICDNDNRFHYYMFPKNFAVPDVEIEEAHKEFIGKWRLVSPKDVKEIL